MKAAAATTTKPAVKAKATIATKVPKLTTPPNTGFGAMVAAKASPAPTPVAAKPAPVARPVLQEQNGRKEYTPGTIGYRIWSAAAAIQAATPNTPVKAEAVRLALPDVSPASVSAGLSHWRKFNGTLHVKGH